MAPSSRASSATDLRVGTETTSIFQFPLLLLAAAALSAGCAGPARAQGASASSQENRGSATHGTGVEGSREAVSVAAASQVHVRRGPGARLAEPIPVDEAAASAAKDGAPGPRGSAQLFPSDGLLYDPYLAAPRQSRMGVKLIFPVGGDDRNRKIENALGLHRSVVRWSAEGEPAAGTEVQFEAGVFARFDIKEHWDMDASDWRFGIPVVHRDGDLAWKIHLYHLTSHLGDEYIDRTGSEHITYHLEEAAFGVSWDVSAGSRLYGEAGVAIYAGPDTDNGRVQVGWEWVGSKASTGLSPYFALDIQARHEQEWTPGKTAALGLAYGTHVRLGVEYYHGRDTQTQFLDERVHYVALNLAIDF